VNVETKAAPELWMLNVDGHSSKLAHPRIARPTAR
jgi:hypothetical protein